MVFHRATFWRSGLAAPYRRAVMRKLRMSFVGECERYGFPCYLLTSTAPDGQTTANEFTVGTVRFNQRDRVHTEVLARGAGRAIITELK